MKEYKVVNTKASLIKRNEKLEELFNQFAREGWELKFLYTSFTMAVFERDKNKM